jgi:hypothetical protein
MTEAIFGADHDLSLTVAHLIANLEIDWTRQRLPQIGDFGQEGAAWVYAYVAHEFCESET